MQDFESCDPGSNPGGAMMKLVLTSAGITNQSIENSIKKLLNQQNPKIAFIPTAANTKNGGKGWLIDHLNEFRNLGEIDIIDIAALKKEIWLPKLKQSNIIVMGGGDTTYLMNQIKNSGLIKELPQLLKDKIYVGISAGSIVLCPTLFGNSEYLHSNHKQKSIKGLNYVDFHFRPHLNSPSFPKVIDKNLKEIAKKINKPLYALDNNSAIFISNNKLKIISEGQYIKYN